MMIRKLLIKLGMIKTLLIITAVSILSSVFLYVMIGIFWGGIAVVGIVISIIAPAILAPFFSYFLLRLSFKLDLAERALVKVNNELELRVKQRTAELVKANEAFRAKIAEHKRAEEALLESEKRLETILNSIQAGIAVIDAETHVIVDANTVAIGMIGMPKEQTVGHVCHKFICPAEEYKCPITDLGQSVDQSERVLLNASGESTPILKSVIPTILGGRRYLIENFLDITERKRAQEQIQASLREKEVLLKEIHHRVKNNLQVISSLLYLQLKNIRDEEAFEMLQDSQNRVRSMALVHERLYQSQDLTRVDFAEYIRSLANYLFRSYGVNSNLIKLETNVEHVPLGIDTAIPCGLILNELVSNSLKHAFTDGRRGEIRIEFHSDNDNKFALMVSDNGAGFPQDLDFRDTESLGLQLVNTLVDQLEGTIELDRSSGTAFEMTFTALK